jgi:hypothetical protein
VAKPKEPTLDETISQVYDEIHAGENEAPAEGFIGKHLQKLKEQKHA